MLHVFIPMHCGNRWEVFEAHLCGTSRGAVEGIPIYIERL